MDALREIASEPSLGKKLKGELEGSRTYRAWPYRIVYEVDDRRVWVVTIGHRKDVYR